MSFPQIIERPGSLSGTGFSKEATFRTPVSASTWLPMTSNSMEADPGWFSPTLMQGVRDKQIYNLYGEAKYNGAITGPIFPSNAMELLSASIGADAAIGYGVAGTYATPTSTTSSGTTSAGATTITVASASGLATGQQITIDSGSLLEVRKISNVVSTTITVADPLLFAHASGVAVSTGTTTTLNGATSSSATTVTVTSATGIVQNSIIQIDVNSPSGTTTSEVRKVTNVATNTLTLDSALTYAHGNGAQVILVVAPYLHAFTVANTLPSLTIEKVIGGFQSLQFAGSRVSKFDLKAPVGNTAVEITADMMACAVAVLDTPTQESVVNELPYVFTEAGIALAGNARADASNVTVSIDNALKATYTYSGQHGPSFLTPVTLHTSGGFDVVWSSLDDPTYGDFTRMENGTLGSLYFSLTHPANAGTITIVQPQVALSKYSNDVKSEDVVMSTITYEASRALSGTSQFTIMAFVQNSVYVSY